MSGHLPYCPNCGEVAEQPFCGACGQRQGNYEVGLLGLFRTFVSETLEIDRRFGRTLRRLFFDPGRITAEYVQDRRRHYTHPVKLLLFSTMLLVAALSLTGRLERGLQVETGFGSLILDIGVAEEGQLSDAASAALRSAYHEQLLAAFPWLLSIPLPAAIFALALASIASRRRRPAVTHVVFVIHETCIALMLTTMLVVLDPPAWAWSAIALLCAHGLLALRRTYDLRWARALGMGLLALATMLALAAALTLAAVFVAGGMVKVTP
jgi:hypothetical protein